MNPRELEVYDNYPRLVTSLVSWATQVAKMPLDEMKSAVDRMRLTSAFIGPESSQHVDPQTLSDHAELLDIVLRFRDEYIALAVKTQRSP